MLRLALLALCLWTPLAVADDSLETVAEKSGYKSTARHGEVLTLIDRLVGRAAHLKRVDFGQTSDGRAMAAVVAGTPGKDKLVALLLGNIHAGECAGKEALLMLLRELALNPNHPLLERLVLVVVPNYNADGNERMGQGHRPGQIGPTNGMGLRTNAQGLDLNRDFLKLEAPETRALVGLINRFDPHLFIDCHTTNGSRHRYQLTYDIPHNPACPPAVRNFLRQKMMPAVTRSLEAEKLHTFYYGNFNKARNRWTSFGHEGRYSTEYVGLRGRLAILSEAYSYIPYKQRILATRRFVRECLRYVSKHHVVVRRLLANIEPAARVAMKTQVTAFDKPVTIKGPDKDYTARFFGNYQATQHVTRPQAYLIPFDQSRLVDRLRMHGIKIEQLTQARRLRCEVYRVKKLTRARRAFQKHRLLTTQVTARTLTREVPAKTYVVRTDQPLGTLATTLLEPTSDDSLLVWNFLDHALRQGQDLPIVRLLSREALPLRSVERIEPAQLLTLDQIYGPSHRVAFSGSSRPRVSWIAGTTSYRRQQGQRAAIVDARTGSVSRVRDDRRQRTQAFAKLPGITSSVAASMAGAGRTSPDGRWRLINRANDLFVYDTKLKRARRLTFSAEPERDPTISPDSRLVAFVRNHNLYVVALETGRERALTTRGTPLLLYGELDWVYQEELYGRGRFRAFWWSPDSSRLALLRLDQSRVKTYTVTDNIPTRQKLEVTRYPKAGDPLPKVSLGVVEAAGGKVTWLDHRQFDAMDHLIVRVAWNPSSKRVIYQLQNRRQSWLSLRSGNPRTGANRELLRETSKAWVSSRGNPRWLKDGSFLWVSERSGTRHVYQVSASGKRTRAVTSGDYDVRSLLGLDPKEQWLYFASTRDSAIATHGYRVLLNGGQPVRLTRSPGNHRLQFDDRFRYYIDSVSRAHSPSRSSLHRSDGTFVRTIDPNRTDYLDYYKLNKPEFLTVPTDDGGKLQAMLIKPPDFDPNKRYPVMCYLYGGPMAGSVWDSWRANNYLWHQMLAQKGYVIWICDNRSASTTGIKHSWPVYRDMGRVELRDIETGLRWLKRKPWIDGKRIGIWGWSYGGYIASYALTHSKMFSLGIAGAPVTDWRNYDAIYTERYMDLPQNNPKGYDSSSVVKAAKNLHGKLLIIHGEMDDNVHLSNTMQLAHALQKAGKQFQLMIYPRNRHGVRSRHLRDLMTQFILDNM